MQVAVVIPVWKEELSLNEEISLKQNISILAEKEIILITHRALNLNNYSRIFKEAEVHYNIIYFSRKYFNNTDSYNKLLISLNFYLHFLKYQFILICQLDAFVFKNQLDYWTEQKYSYIGAPWLEGFHDADSKAQIIGVGNGGFSLRKVKDHIRVLLSFNYLEDVKPLVKHLFAFKEGTFIGRFLLLLKYSTVTNNTFFLFNTWKRQEDLFWGTVASRYHWYGLPDPDTAARFSWEVHPSRFYDEIGELPFGCHAWWSYDLQFWIPHIEQFGYRIDAE